jgi:glutathione S-transferase
MSDKLELLQITGSPNNIKVRIALGLKGLAYEGEALEIEAFPGDRSPVIAMSAQPRTPVLRHGKSVIFDSSAILRYLEANFPDTPRLFSEDYFEMGAIEEWEMWARTTLEEPVGIIFGQVFALTPDKDLCQRATAAMVEATWRIEDTLEKRPFLLGDKPTAADVVAAPAVNLATIPDSPDNGPIMGFFHRNFSLGEERERTRSWVKQMMAFDPESTG